jgi:hypothetical protein
MITANRLVMAFGYSRFKGAPPFPQCPSGQGSSRRELSIGNQDADGSHALIRKHMRYLRANTRIVLIAQPHQSSRARCWTPRTV